MRIIYLLCFLFIVTLTANGQVRNGSLPAGTVKMVKFYPNPAVTQITFDFEAAYDKTYSFQVFNFTGKKVLEIYSITPKAIVSVSDFYRGIYIFQLKDRTGRILESGKFEVAK
jgi:Secretion system C-terminal sorting domain